MSTKGSPLPAREADAARARGADTGGLERLWFFGEEGRPAGPVGESVLRRMLDQGEIEPSTRIWADGLARWVPIAAVRDLRPSDTAALWAEELGAWSPRPGVARRALARGLDLLATLVLSAVVAVWIGVLTQADLWVLGGLGLLLGPFCGALGEAIAVTHWGTTPGKALLALRIRTERQARPPFPAALRRAVLVWWRGLAAGVPPLMPVAAVVAGRRLAREGIAPWDRVTRLVVEQRAFRRARQGLVVRDSTR